MLNCWVGLFVIWLGEKTKKIRKLYANESFIILVFSDVDFTFAKRHGQEDPDKYNTSGNLRDSICKVQVLLFQTGDGNCRITVRMSRQAQP